MSEFTNKVVLVTGGTAGIGKTTAKMFSEAGAKVIISGRSPEKGRKAEQEMQQAGLNIHFIQANAASADSNKALIEHTIERFGRLDIAFNNAGFGGDINPIHQQEETNWDNVINANLKGVWLSMKYQIAQFLQQNDQAQYSIVNMSSIWGLGASNFGVSPYVAAKHGVIGLTEAAALEYAQDNIRVNAVCPGWIYIEEKEHALNDPEFRKEIAAHHPVNRLGTPEDVASAVLWLASEQSGFVTGHSMAIDGGISARR